MGRYAVTGRTFYRLVRTTPPTADDWLPQAKLPGRWAKPASHPLAEHWNEGISVWDTVDAARRQNAVIARRKNGSPFRFIARLDFGAYPKVECDDTIRTPNHWTLFGPTAEIEAAVTSSNTQV